MAPRFWRCPCCLPWRLRHVPACAPIDRDASAAAAGHRPAAAEVRLVVTRDFGAKVLVDTVAPWKKGMNVMRLLAEHATVDTGYGGQFVSGIDGLRSIVRLGLVGRRRRLVLLGRRRHGRRRRRRLAAARRRDRVVGLPPLGRLDVHPGLTRRLPGAVRRTRAAHRVDGPDRTRRALRDWLARAGLQETARRRVAERLVAAARLGRHRRDARSGAAHTLAADHPRRRTGQRGLRQGPGRSDRAPHGVRARRAQPPSARRSPRRTRRARSRSCSSSSSTVRRICRAFSRA